MGQVLQSATIVTKWALTYHPPNRKKIREKNGKCNQNDFLLVLSKSSWTTFKTILETLSALGACHVTIIGEVVYKKSMIFKVLGVYVTPSTLADLIGIVALLGN